MLKPRIVHAALALCLALGLTSTAHAEDRVPVPDVRGMTESQARDALNRAGLRLGGAEPVDMATLQREFGRTYAAGTIVQQSPPPSVADQPSWLPRGDQVWVRVAAGSATIQTPRALPPIPTQPGVPSQPTLTTPPMPTQPPIPAPPAQPGVVTRVPTTYTPEVRFPSTRSAGVPPRPPPPYSLDGAPVAPAPRTVIPVPQPTQPNRPIGVVPQTPAPTAQVPVPQASTPTRTGCYTLSCERKENGWHIRASGGVGFWTGTDSPDLGFYGGIDLGYSMCNCIGIDVFYRYAGTQFDRTLANGLLEDSGDFHTIGLKATFDKSFSDTSRWYWWAGLGVGYFKSRRFQVDDDGVTGYAELGVGYMLSNSMRARLGLNVQALDTVTGRADPANDNSGRLLMLWAPTLGIDLDF